MVEVTDGSGPLVQHSFASGKLENPGQEGHRSAGELFTQKAEGHVRTTALLPRQLFFSPSSFGYEFLTRHFLTLKLFNATEKSFQKLEL